MILEYEPLTYFYCYHCGSEVHDESKCATIPYVATYANGSSYRCPFCKKESVQG